VNFDLSSALAAVVPGRPLVVSDADGVLLCFTSALKHWLRERGFTLELTSYRLEGAVRRADDGTRLLDVETRALIDEYRADLDWLPAVAGACEALAELSQVANVVVLSNITYRQALARRRNLEALGLDFPLIANDGGTGYLADKGTAVKALAARAKAPAFFIDDIPSNLADVAKRAPEVTLIHLVESPALRDLLGTDFPAHCHAGDWAEAAEFILERVK
jgi:hypothetical protein